MRFYWGRLLSRQGAMRWLVLLLLFANPATTQAHGGVVIDTGFTDHFEWLVSIDPYPTLLGEAMVTLLVYDIATYEPVNDLKVTVYLAAPDAPRPCCQPEQHTGPIALTVDPQIYPGDYSNLISLDQPGTWEIQFNATAPATAAEKSFSLVVPLTVNASMGGSAPIPLAAATPDVAATATSFAQNVAAARQGDSPLPAPASPIAAPDAAEPVAIVRTAWWLWGGVGLIPIVLIGWLILRSPGRQADGLEAEEQEEADD
jgi:hypothetical protein